MRPCEVFASQLMVIGPASVVGELHEEPPFAEEM
jgi:hypothetical protein